MVAATIRRMLSVLLLTTLLGVGGGVAAVSASAVARVSQDGSSPGARAGSYTPGSQVRGEKFTRYCVKNYQPNSTVKVTNEKTGQTVYIHTDSDGNGCVKVPVEPGCQKIVASGVDVDGDTTTSSANVCVLGEKTQRSNGSLPFTGSNIILPGIGLGILLIAAGTAITVVLRRRRPTPA